MRRKLAAVIAVLVMALAASGCAEAFNRMGRGEAMPTTDEQKVVNAVNGFRAEHGLLPLKLHSVPTRKARLWSVYMANGVCGFNNDFYGRICHSNLEDGIDMPWLWLGENVGMGVPRSTLDGIIHGLENSPGHRANILSPRAEYLGVGVAYQGDAVYVTQEFLDAP